jgi:hypothetical protein
MPAAFHQLELLGRLDRPGILGHGLAFHHLEALGADRVDAQVRQAVDGEALVAGAVLGHEVGDLVAEAPRHVLGVGARREVVERGHDPVLVDRRQVLGEVGMVRVVEQHHGPLGRHEDAAGLVVRTPDLHVGGVGRVTGVDLVEQQQAAVVAPHELLAQPAEAVAAHRVEVDRRLAVLHGAVLARGVALVDGFGALNRHEELLGFDVGANSSVPWLGQTS